MNHKRDEMKDEQRMANDEIKILLVDDSEDEYVLLSQVFSDIGDKRFNVEWIDTYDAALETILQQRHDVCLIDYRLGAKDGVALIRETLTQGCRTPMIILTGLQDRKVDLEAMESGAMDYLVKGNIDSDRLDRAIRYAIQQSKAQNDLYNLIEKNADGVLIVDETGVIDYLNPAAEVLLGRTIRELKGEVFGFPITIGQTTELELLRLGQDNSIVEMRVVETEWQGKKVRLASMRDITDRKMVEKQIKAYSDKLQETNATKDTFFSIISHDLKGPLSSQRKMTEFLVNDLEDLDQEEILDYAQRIHSSTIKLQELLEHLLQWSQLTRGKIECHPEEIDLQNTCDNVIALFSENAVAKKIKLAHHIQPQTFVLADPDMLDAILQNLVSNAIKFTHPEGEVTITAGRPTSGAQDLEPLTLNLSSEAKRHIKISVTDNGMGIPAEDLDKLFKIDEKYSEQGTAGEQGTGLGLVLCHEFVRKNGGVLKVESQESSVGLPTVRRFGHQRSGGTTFTFTLPAIQTLPESPKPKPNQTHASEKILVLVAEDDPDNQFIIKKMLKKIDLSSGSGNLSKLSFDIATNGLEALELLKQNTYRLILMDIQMPEMDGIETTQQIREQWPLQPSDKKRPIIIGWTSHDDSEMRKKCLEAGMDDFCSKDISVEDLQTVLEKWI